MDLCTVSVSGFRRFRDRATLKTNGKLVAILGPNEAGKSSLLQAIRLLDNNEPPAAGDFSRGGDRAAFAIEGRFFLSKDDLAAAGLDGPHWLIVRKVETGERTYWTSPPAPKRDISGRKKLLEAMRMMFKHPRFIAKIPEDKILSIKESWEKFEIKLSDKIENLAESTLPELEEFILYLTPFFSKSLPAAIKNIPDIYAVVANSEKIPNPRESSIKVLKDRLPSIVIFNESARNLAPEYAIDELKSRIPLAFDNLCDVAKLDPSDLIAAYETNDNAALTTIEHKVNSRLESRFRTDWKQSGIHVSMRMQHDRVSIQVVNEKAEFTSLAERSDGLRQFVALLAFAGGRWNEGTILLIDEAEQRLHYDAQADLVQMLARQKVASKVIYTTHSAGCLPEDLGNGVRFARPGNEDGTLSEICNNFWAENNPGFTPLLFGMGAGTLAFFPTRNAVMVEGASDMLLLPTMMRNALNVEVLGFQFVPGLAYTDGPLHAPMIGNATGVLYLVDGDSGGIRIKNRLADLGISNHSIFVLKNADGTANEIEDFLHIDLLVDAFNNIIEKFVQNTDKITKSSLPQKLRMSAIDKYYKSKTGHKLSKVSLAYEILDLLADHPDRAVLDSRRSSAFRSVAASILSRFRAIPQNNII